MLKLEAVHKSYGNKKIIEDLSFEVTKGEIVGFIGRNGAGKTTTINMITGITPITSGEITIDEFNLQEDPVRAKQELGLVPDNPELFSEFTVIKFFEFMMDIYGVDREAGAERVEHLSKEFETEKYLKDSIQDLSHGTRQKVMIIGVLLHEPKVWILDEPMTGLDPNAAFILKEKMKEHAQKGNVVLFSTHVLEVAEKLCSRIVIIEGGKAVYSGTLENLKQKYPDTNSLEEVFFEVTKK